MRAVLPEEVPTTVLVDRDGVINANRSGYVRRWEDFVFLPGALPALALLAQNGLGVVVITNQAGINHGVIPPATLDEIHARMCAAIAGCGGRVDGVLHCPHRPDEDCLCRKPRPGLLYRAQRELGVDLHSAILVGDHWTDLEAARRAGCRSLLVLSGRTPDYPCEALPTGCVGVAPDLLAAARRIVEAGTPPPVGAAGLPANGRWEAPVGRAQGVEVAPL